MRVLVPLICLGLAACATPEPVAYKDLGASSYLGPNPINLDGRTPYRYTLPVQWRQYSHIIIDPVQVYGGADAQFGTMSAADKADLAAYMQTTFTDVLRERFKITDKASPGTLRLKLTLTGASKTTPVLGTLSRFDLAGGLYNGVQTMRGGEGLLTGSVIYEVEVYDAPTSKLLSAFVTKQYPGPYDLGAGITPLGAAKTGIKAGAKSLLREIS